MKFNCTVRVVLRVLQSFRLLWNNLCFWFFFLTKLWTWTQPFPIIAIRVSSHCKHSRVNLSHWTLTVHKLELHTQVCGESWLVGETQGFEIMNWVILGQLLEEWFHLLRVIVDVHCFRHAVVQVFPIAPKLITVTLHHRFADWKTTYITHGKVLTIDQVYRVIILLFLLIQHSDNF